MFTCDLSVRRLPWHIESITVLASAFIGDCEFGNAPACSSEHHHALLPAYIAGPDGKIQTAYDLDCEDDQAAVAAAKQFVNGHDVELWQQARKVAVLEHKTE